MGGEVIVADRAPTIDEYRALCTAVGWEPVVNFEVAPDALAASLTACVALADDRVVGMFTVTPVTLHDR